jgi:S-adenosylmethionine:tRNA-ribosyltransferase-isomerase (queuine synthetase)
VNSSRCLVTAGKHNNNTRVIPAQLLGKRDPTATDTHVTVAVLLDYNSGNCVFYVVRAEMLQAWSVEFRS